MNNILTILFAILDCKVWSVGQVADWADQLLSKLDSPKAWLLDLSNGTSIDDCLKIVREAMREFGVSLPEDIGELMAGFILLRYNNGELSEEAARSLLVDIVDTYETSNVDAEAAGTFSLDRGGYSK